MLCPALLLAENPQGIELWAVVCIHSVDQAVPCLTHWGQVTHICVSKPTIIGSDNGLSPGRRQAIIYTNAGILLNGSIGTNFNRNSYTFIQENPFENAVWKMTAILPRPQWVNRLLPGDEYMLKWIGSSLVQAKIVWCQVITWTCNDDLDLQEQVSMKFLSEIHNFEKNRNVLKNSTCKMSAILFTSQCLNFLGMN